MLIEFQVSNFRSFRTSQTLSMVAASFAEHTGTNTFDSKLRGFGQVLRSAALYGPNAAGKTNLLLALQFMQGMILQSASAGPTTDPPYAPFKLSKATRAAPTEFRITFVQGGVRYEYGFSNDAKRVRKEWLMEYVHPRGRAIFERTYIDRGEKYQWSFSSFLKGRRSVWSEATRPNALFLSTAAQLNSKQLLPVFEWFQKRLVVIVGASKLNPTLTLQLLDKPNGRRRLMPFIREADLGIADITVTREPLPAGDSVAIIGGGFIEQTPNSQVRNLVKITFSHLDDEAKPVLLGLADESAGTQIFFSTAGAWLNVFANGEIILIDEIDTSLHPLLIKYLISKFHSNSTNPRNAQLVFTTHNTSLLTQEMFRRDQIWFVEKDNNGSTRLYSLTDFKPRSDEVLERWYLRGRYGALPILKEPSGGTEEIAAKL
jgi:AAA15 family ATPase/GTPase